MRVLSYLPVKGIPTFASHQSDKSIVMAESEGFEPSIQVYPVCFLSREVPSTTRPALRFETFYPNDKAAILREISVKINEKDESIVFILRFIQFKSFVQNAYS